MADVEAMATAIQDRNTAIDVLINNAGVLKTADPRTADGLDTRFMVNSFSPYVLTRRLLPVIPRDGRIVNLSSAAQAPVDMAAMAGEVTIDDMSAYSQSKLAITIWSQALAKELKEGPVVVAVNPGSLLATKMVREGFNFAGHDINIGGNIVCQAATADEFSTASGQYFDNDAKCFSAPHAAACDAQHSAAVMQCMEEVISRLL